MRRLPDAVEVDEATAVRLRQLAAHRDAAPLQRSAQTPDCGIESAGFLRGWGIEEVDFHRCLAMASR